MKKLKIPILFLVFVIFSIPSKPQVQIKSAFPNLSFTNSVDLQNAGDASNRIFVVELAGRIKVFPNTLNVNETKTFLNISDRVLSGGELGLLGLAFHPDYENNGYFFVNYTVNNPRRSRISRFRVSENNPDSADKNSEVILITVYQPYENHNGGQLAFGNDGYLYASFGDGGSGEDPLFKGQTDTTLLGKILRIDINNYEGELNYSIPPDNPYKNSSGNEKKEIFAKGLRNPWRFSFDPVTGKLWCGDVGQYEWEEISIIEKGKNYGWSCLEGFEAGYNLSLCDDADYSAPIWVYSHGEGQSITGGHVYRGVNIPELYGKYIYGDYGSRRIWALEYDGNSPAKNNLLFTSSRPVTAFGVDEDNEIYFTTYGNPINNSKIYKIAKTAPLEAPTFLRAVLNGVGVTLLNWDDNSNNESGFKIERKSRTGSFQEIASVNSNQTGYLDLNLLDTTRYTYRVYAYNNEGSSSYSNQSSVTVTAVPVELSSFTAKIKGNGILLEWSTASETNNKHFEVERFITNSWENISVIDGNGTTTVKNNYSYFDKLDNIFHKGNIRYRLKQVDFDGSSSYSKEIEVNIDLIKKEYNLEQNFPNPFNPSTKIIYSIPEESKVKIIIFNVLGKEVEAFTEEIKAAGKHTKEWIPVQLTSGVYYIKLTAQSLISEKNYSKVIKTIFIK